MNPYLVLAVPPDADDLAIRHAYLEAVKESPPESDPKRFQAVNRAYEQIKDKASRRRYILFNRDCPARSPLETLVAYTSHARVFKPLPMDAMKQFLAAVASGPRK